MKPQLDALRRNKSHNHDPLPGASKFRLEQYLPKPMQKEEMAVKQKLPDLSDIEGDVEFQRKLSFQSIPFKDKLNEFDKKYTWGRFGHQQDDTLESFRVRTISDLKDRTIPRVGLLSSIDQGSSHSPTILSDKQY